MAYSTRQQISFASQSNASGTTVLYAPLQRVTVHKVGVRMVAAGDSDGTATFQKLVGTATVTTLGTVAVATANVGKLMYVELNPPVEIAPGNAVQLTQEAGSSVTTLLPTLDISINEDALADSPVG